MKKKTELTVPDMFYIVNSTDEDGVAAKNVGCTKKTVETIRQQNPKTVPENNPLKVQTEKGQPAFVMTESISSMGDDDRYKPKPKPPVPDYITNVKR